MIPDIPRASWHDHPHYPEQTLLLGSHEAFRNQSSYILEALGSLDPADQGERRKRERWVRRMSRTFHWWMSGMRGHERYEETKLYPYLQRRYDHAFDLLEDGHVHLNERKQFVTRAFDLVVVGDPDEAVYLEDLIGGLKAHRDTLLEHLALEEDTVIPMLLALPPEEFRRYALNPISVLLPPSPQGDQAE